MATLADALAGQPLFVELPRGGVRDWIAACEVMLQEGLGAWTFPLDQVGEVSQAMAIFGRRGRVGVHGARRPSEVEDAFAAGAHFVTSPVCSPALVSAAGGRPFLAGALTPSEAQSAAEQGAAAVQIVPADVMGMAYARLLPALLPDVAIVATGRLERFLVEMWRQGGARAVGLSQTVLLAEDASQAGEFGGDGNDLDAVRRRCQTLADLDVGNP